MSLTLKPYLEYKDSGLSWVGAIPKHWNVQRVKYLLHEIDARSESGTAALLRVSQYTGVTQRSNADEEPDTRAESLVGYKVVGLDDLVINIMLAWNGSLGVSPFNGIVSPAYGVYRFNPGLAPRFYHHLFRTDAYKGRFKVSSTGVVDSRLRLYSDDFYRVEALKPPGNEQEAISRFLDSYCGSVDRLIRAKRRVIELLNEQNQAIIQRAVTRGLTLNVHLKPSGIEWLGDVPAHWDTNVAKYSLFEIDERSNTGDEELLSVSHITGVSPRSQKNITMFMAASYVGHKLCRAGDLVVNTMWAWMGALGVSPMTGIVSPSYAVYRLRNSDAFVPGFLDRLLRTPPYISEFVCRSTGIRSSRLRLYPEQLLRIPLIQPPRTEQEKIVETLNAETRGIAKAIQSTQREIDLIREYRTRLIADVVTGKFDVRGVELAEVDATTMPEGLGEMEADNIDDSVDADAAEASEVEA